VPEDDWHELGFDNAGNTCEQLGLVDLVVVESLDQFLSCVHNDLTRERDHSDALKGSLVQLQRTLVTEFV